MRILLFAALLGSVVGHICIFSPRQRSILSVDQPGDPTCYRRVGECGGPPSGAPKTTYVAGQEVMMHFQQNLNHWYPPMPGHFDISFSTVVDNPSPNNFSVLYTFDDFTAHDMVSQVNFSVPVTIPNVECSHCVLRFRYVSNNPMEIDPPSNKRAIFYQCSDITIVKSNATASPPSTSRKPVPTKQNMDKSCTAPPVFQTTAVETRETGVVRHRVWYDATMLMVRWDRMGAIEPNVTNGVLVTWTNFTSEREYLYYPLRNMCLVYGPDKFYLWAYGPSNGQFYAGQETIAGQVCDVWENAGNGFRWTSTADTCLPVSVQHGDRLMLFRNTTTSISNPKSIFSLPSQCHEGNVIYVEGGCGDLKKRLRMQQ